VLVENRTSGYKRALKDLVNKPSVQFVKLNIQQPKDINWKDLVATHFPHGVIQTRHEVNNNLLFVANLTDRVFSKSYYTPSRTWAALMEDCLRETGLHFRGKVHILSLIPSEHLQLILPRTILERGKAALVTEMVSANLINLGETASNEVYTGQRDWDLITKSAHRVAERSIQATIPCIPQRERPPLLLAPESTDQKGITVPYVPRVRRDMHQGYLDALEEMRRIENRPIIKKQKEDLRKTHEEFSRRRTQLNQDNKVHYQRLQLAEQVWTIDGLESKFAAAVTNKSSEPEKLEELNRRLVDLKSKLTQSLTEGGDSVSHRGETLVDNRRAALRTGNIDDSILAWDHRPFEPLYIKPEEIFPSDSSFGVLYFEPKLAAETLPSLTSILNMAGPQSTDKNKIIDIFLAVIGTFGTRGRFSIASILGIMFPGRSTNDIVKDIPTLVPFASKRLKSTIAYSSSDASPTNEKPKTLEDHFDYDFSHQRIRCLPLSVMTDLIIEYIKWPFRPNSPAQISRHLGGSMTSYSSASSAFEFDAGKAGGKINKL
jgi:mitochondrial transcription factor 1